MLPWFKIVKPYPFIESLGKREDLLVADLGDVLTGVAHPMYRDPKLFVKTTHFTDGLIQFLRSILRKISTGEGNSIIRLQAQFGGGKTHSLIAAHHLLTNQKFFTQVLPTSSLKSSPKIVRIIGTHLNPLEGRQEKDNQIYTPWGELAYQLKGIEGYESLRENDRGRISPGKASLFALLSSSEPVVILLDEITEFIAKARGVKVNDSNLGIQTLTFLQELTECVRSLEKSILVITLPYREYEVNKDDKPLLIEIDQILGRLASSAIPSERSDLYQIVQKKLIAEVLDNNSLDLVVEMFSQYYFENKKSFPEYTTAKSYHSLMISAFPFHPATIDILFDKWQNFPSFQGTRTLLSILARILNELKIHQSEISIINPSDIDLTKKPINLLFSRYLSPNFAEKLSYEFNLFETLIHPRISTGNSKKLGKKIISTIFLNSIPSSNTQGALLEEIYLGIYKPDMDLALASEILDSLSHTLEFFHNRENRYFISETPNINKKIKESKNSFENEALQEIKESLLTQKANQSISVLVWPKSSDEVPDDTKLKIVLFSPFMEEQDIDSWITLKGERFRIYQNTILLSHPKVEYLDRLKNTFQEKLSILRILETKDNNSLYNEDRQKLNSRLLTLEEGVGYLLNHTYVEFTDGAHHYTLVPPKVLEKSSIRWIIQELIKNEVIVKKIHPIYIKENFLIEKRKINTRSLLDQFLKNLIMPKLLNTQILQESIVEGVKNKIFLYESFSEHEELSNSSHQDLVPANIFFTKTELIGIPNQSQNNSIDTETLHEDKRQEERKIGLSLEFNDLNTIELQSVWKGILQTLEMEKGDLHLGLTLSIKNPEIFENKMTLILIKEIVSQVGGKIKEQKSVK